ncbi:unnamed protein product [Aureobasidium uvarum]|uniref:DUF6697 domain-containing protein n=1 Tax=Aureobasidium uvarum TaxID=2773716 RepID=A0A9N8KCQ8_9PEZI|nr:unnamed protein product [Aureobasidium uvarum]
MDSGIQSPDVADPFMSRSWNLESYYSAMAQPLAGSMHAIVPQTYMPTNPQMTNTDIVMMRQLDNRITSLEQQQFQDGLDSHYRHMQTSQSLQYLQRQVQRLQSAITYDIPSLRLEVSDLQARLNARENDDCTRQIQLEPRTHNQKLESAMKNVNLMRIYAGVSLHGNATFEQVSLRAAEQMEALAKTLRGRVYRGGAAYLLEAEDAEAWAAKLREDIKPAEKRKVDEDLWRNCEFCLEEQDQVNAADFHDVGHATTDTEPSRHVDVTLEKIASSMTLKEIESWKAPSPQSEATKSSRARSPSSAKKLGLVQNTTSTHEEAAPSQASSAKDSAHQSQRAYSPKGSPSTVSIKIEESSTSESSLVRLQVAQPQKLALDSQHAIPTVETIESLVIEPETNTETAIGDTIDIPKVDRAQVPPKRLPPHRRFPSAQTGAPKLAEVELDITARNETPATPTTPTTGKSKKSKRRRTARVRAAETEVVQTDHAKSPARTKKLPPHRKRFSEQIDAPEHEADVTRMDEALPSEAVESNAVPADGIKAVRFQDAVEVEQKQLDQNFEKDVSSDEQDEPISTLDLNFQIWQPTYLKELPLLPTDKLEAIPSSQEMHGFDRTFITTHLGGTKWFPSFYTIPESELSLLPGRGYFLLENITEPLAPSTPGSHGGLLTPVLRLPEADDSTGPKPESMQSAPLFLKRGDKYIYYGMYSYLRSDRWDIERCSIIPTYLKQHWATQLTSPHRPKWVTDLLQHHLLPQPTYSRPTSSSSEDAVLDAITAHHQALDTWHRDTHLKISFLRPETMLAAFEAPDTGTEMPGIRFWCLGLECEGWDKGFYDMMVREEKVWEKQGRRDGEKEREAHQKMLKMLGKGKPVKW